MNDRRHDAIAVAPAAPGHPPQCCSPAGLQGPPGPGPLPLRHCLDSPHPRPAVAALDRWGLLDRLVATGCPAISTYCFDTGPSRFQAGPRPLRPPRAVLLVGPISGPAAVKITANLVRSGLRPVALTVAEMPCRRRSAGRRLGVKGAGRLCRALPR